LYHSKSSRSAIVQIVGRGKIGQATFTSAYLNKAHVLGLTCTNNLETPATAAAAAAAATAPNIRQQQQQQHQ